MTRPQGWTLVELLVGLTGSLLILGLAATFWARLVQSVSRQAALSFELESACRAISSLRRDRMATRPPPHGMHAWAGIRFAAREIVWGPYATPVGARAWHRWRSRPGTDGWYWERGEEMDGSTPRWQRLLADFLVEADTIGHATDATRYLPATRALDPGVGNTLWLLDPRVTSGQQPGLVNVPPALRAWWYVSHAAHAPWCGAITEQLPGLVGSRSVPAPRARGTALVEVQPAAGRLRLRGKGWQCLLSASP